jgi:uncharacterized protein (DUF427 family)
MRPKRIEPGPGQESVWDYPRPPRLEPVIQRITVELNGATVADTTAAFRVLETSHPPVYYLPPTDVDESHLTRTSDNGSFCEWKGTATYWTVAVGNRVERDAAWSYERPSPPFEAITGYLAFYCQRMDRCTVGGDVVTPQPGGFYGGWITPAVVGPFKGSPGSMGW